MKRLVREKRSVFVRMVLLFSIPLALLSAISFASYTIYTHQLREDLFNEYGENLNQLAGRIAVTLEELNSSVLFLREFDDVKRVLDEVGDAREIDPRVLNRAARALGNYGHTREVVASIWIYFRESGLILSSGGTASDSFFFGQAHEFESYDLEFWQRIPFRSSSSLSLLQPTVVTDDFGTGRYIPLVFSGIGPSTARNLVVVELDVAALKSMFAPYLFTVDSTLAFTDGTGTPYLVHSSLDSDVSALGLDGTVGDVDPSTGVQRIRRGNDLVIAQPIQIFRHPYVLLAIVPNSAIRSRTAALGATVLALLSAGLVVSLLLAYLFSRRLYAPLHRLMRRVQTRDGSSTLHPGDEYAYLMTEMDRLFAREQELRHDLSQALPLAYERCLTEIVREGNLEHEQELRSFLRERGADFRYGNYVVLLIRYEYSADYYRSFSEQSEMELRATMSALLSTALCEHAVIHQVRLEPHLQCIVCNVDDTVESSDIRDHMQRLIRSVDVPKDLLRLHVSIGLVHRDIRGISLSHEEARQRLSLMIESESQVQVYSGHTRSSYVLDRDAERRIENYLQVGSSEDALRELEQVVQINAAESTGEAAMRALFFHLYSLALQILTRAGDSADDNDLSLRLDDIPMFELHNRIREHFTRVASRIGDRHSAADIRQVVEYIHGHYAENIYLEGIADRYGISYKHLSHRIKAYLGIPFQSYLSGIRIEKAKELLSTTSLPVAEVGAAVGYESQSTFFRVFKKREGVTAGDYRRAQQTTPDAAR